MATIKKRTWTLPSGTIGSAWVLSYIDSNGNRRRPQFGLHMLRHVAVSLWIEQGASPKRVSQLAGHSSVQFTLDTYGHLWPNADADSELAASAERSIMSA